jgi:hypothetical protein
MGRRLLTKQTNQTEEAAEAASPLTTPTAAPWHSAGADQTDDRGEAGSPRPVAEHEKSKPLDLPVDVDQDGPRDAADTADNKPREQLSPAMKSAFLHFRKTQLAQRSSRVALALSKLMRIRLPYPRQIEAMAEIEELRLLGLEMRGEQQLALNIFNRTGTGKSTIASQYKLMRELEDPEGVQSVLHARMGTSGSARDLYVAIMSELGDGFASSGTEHTLRRRAMRMMEEKRVELLILDETQHSGQKSGFSRDVTAELKILLDTGHVPIVLLGTEAAVPLIGADRELSGRMFSPCRLDPLNTHDEDDFDLWKGFVGGLDACMVEEGIVTAQAGLGREDIALALGEVCDGVIGQVMRVMTMALRNTVRDRRQVVTIEDIARAVDEWSIEHGFANSNPFWKL